METGKRWRLRLSSWPDRATLSRCFTDQNAAITYGVYSLPTTLFIDAEGYLTAYAPGAIPRESLLQGIDMIR